MIKIGCDVVEIARIEKSIKNPGFIKKVFTSSEIEHCKNSPQSFAGIYAAKEACLKALGKGISLISQVEITFSESGKPKAVFKNLPYNFEISISHDAGVAMAVAAAQEVL